MSNNNHNPRLSFEEDIEHHPPLSKRPGLNKTVMFTSVIALFFVVLLVLALHLYARCILSRRDRRRRAIIQQLSMGVAAPQTHALQPPKKGLDPSVIATLPTFLYKKTSQPNDPGVECSVCLSVLEDGEMARVLTNCNHTFHERCIDMWLNSNSTCPICRTEAEPQPPEAKGEVEKVEASAPPLMEEASETLGQSSKVGGSSSRLSSFRRMLSRERSERRMHCSGQDDGVEDLERQ